MIKKTLLFLFIFTAVATIGILFTPFSFFQNQLLNLANSSEHLNIKIGAPIEYKLIIPDEFSAKNIEVKIAGYEIKLSEISISINLNSLLTKNIIVEDLFVKVASIKKYDELEWNSYKKETKVDFSQKRFKSILLNNFKMMIESIDLSGYNISDISVSSTGSSIIISPFSLLSEFHFKAFDGLVDGKARITRDDIPSFNLDLNFKEVSKIFTSLKFDGVHLDGKFRLRASGTIDPESKLIVNKVNLLVRAEDMKWRKKDLDKILDAYIDSLQISLLNTAGYLAQGPIGVLLAKRESLEQAGIHDLAEGETDIRKLNLGVDFDGGIASFRDVALATKRHRVAAKGNINLKTSFFDNFSIASVDDSGCSIFIQKVKGVLTRPDIKSVGAIVDEVFLPIADIFKQKVSLASRGCDNFYQGVLD